MTVSPLLQFALTIFLFGSMAYLVFVWKNNNWLKRKNLVLVKRLKRANRKVEAWRKGWGLEKQRFLEALSDAFILVNQQNQVMAANLKAKQLFENSELEGTVITEYVRNATLAREVSKALEAPGDYSSEFFLGTVASSVLDKGEVETHWFIDAAQVSDVEGGRRILIRDITEQYRSDQVRKDFVANASHELRTPLTIIIGYLESMQEDDFLQTSPELSAKFLGIMHKHGLRLQRIVEDMLMISKLETGEHNTLKEEAFDLKECVLDVYTRLESIFEEKKAALSLNFDPPRITFYGDKFYWTQIFFNLIENALKQNLTKNLIVEVGIQISDQLLEIWVSDNGIGIPETHLPYIFKRFYRVESKLSGEIKGTGLGLSIVKRAVEAHQGIIDVASKPGMETKFTMSLPRERVISSFQPTENNQPALSSIRA